MNQINKENEGVDLQEIMDGRKALSQMLKQGSTNQEQQNQPKIQGKGGVGGASLQNSEPAVYEN